MVFLKLTLLVLIVLLAGPLIAVSTGMAKLDQSWHTANTDSAGLAPNPRAVDEPLIQVYAARAFNWRGAFAVHTWVATKRAGAREFVSYELFGWRSYRGQSPLVARRGPPDRRWYGAEPEILTELRGPEVEAVIDRVEAAIASYPFRDQYRAWPGPNSNTFTAWIGREVPELRLDLPPTAVGKDYLGPTTFFAASPSGTGFQVSLFGVIGILAAIEEGLELNLLGLTTGIDPLDLAIKLPGLGRVPG